VIVNNSTNINKTNHFLLQLFEHKKDHAIWCWKCKPWLGTGTKKVAEL